MFVSVAGLRTVRLYGHGAMHCVVFLFTSQIIQIVIVLLGDRGTWVWRTCPESLRDRAQPSWPGADRHCATTLYVTLNEHFARNGHLNRGFRLSGCLAGCEYLSTAGRRLTGATFAAGCVRHDRRGICRGSDAVRRHWAIHSLASPRRPDDDDDSILSATASRNCLHVSPAGTRSSCPLWNTAGTHHTASPHSGSRGRTSPQETVTRF